MTTRSSTPADHGLDAIDVWHRRKWMAIIVFMFASAAAATITMSLPNLYRATASVLVETQHVSEELVRSSIGGELETRLELIRQEIMSRGRLTSLINQLNLYTSLRQKNVPFDAIVERFRRDVGLELETVSQSGRGPTIAFSISYSSYDPSIAAQVANVLATSYVEENTRIRERQVSQTAEFLKAQLSDSRKELDTQEQRIRAFNLSHMGELPQQEAANLASLERLNAQLRLNGDSQLRAMDRRDRLEKDSADLASASLPPSRDDSDTPDLAGRVASLKKQLDDLKATFTDQYPEVIRVRAELAAAERQLSEVPPDSLVKEPSVAAASVDEQRARMRRALGDSDAELKGLKDEEITLRAAVDRYEQRVENAPRRDEESQTLAREYAATKDRYDTLLKRYEEAQLSSKLEHGQSMEQFRILDGAIPPRDPAAPNRLRLLAIGFVLSIGLALGVIVLVERLDTTFHRIEDLRSAVDVPALFSIPPVSTKSGTRRRWRTIAIATVSVAIGLALIVLGSRHLASGSEQLVRLTARGRL